jgi:hypothetical protein
MMKSLMPQRRSFLMRAIAGASLPLLPQPAARASAAQASPVSAGYRLTPRVRAFYHAASRI